MLGLLGAKPLLIALAITIALSAAAVGVTRWQLKAEKAARVAAERALSDYEAAATAVIAERLKAQAAAEQRAAKIAAELKEKHVAEVAGINRRYAEFAERMRADLAAARERAGVPAPADAPGGTDGGDAYGRLAQALARCEAGLRQLSRLQQWIRETR